MFRVKIDFGAMRHAEKTPEHDGVDVETGKSFDDRWGDWAEEMAKTPHPQLTKEDLCRTFRDKFRADRMKDDKSVA